MIPKSAYGLLDELKDKAGMSDTKLIVNLWMVGERKVISKQGTTTEQIPQVTRQQLQGLTDKQQRNLIEKSVLAAPPVGERSTQCTFMSTTGLTEFSGSYEGVSYAPDRGTDDK